MQEFFDLGERLLAEMLALFGDTQHVPPGCERMHLDLDLRHDFLAFGEDVVIEDHEHVVDDRPRVAQRLAEVDLGAAVGGEVLHQQRARPLQQMPLDLGIAPEPLRFLAHVLHRQHQRIGDPGRERDAGGLAAGDGVDALEADLLDDFRRGKTHQRAAHARIGNQLAAIDVDRARPAGGENERLVLAEMHGLHLEQGFGGHLGDQIAVLQRDAFDHGLAPKRWWIVRQAVGSQGTPVCHCPTGRR